MAACASLRVDVITLASQVWQETQNETQTLWCQNSAVQRLEAPSPTCSLSDWEQARLCSTPCTERGRAVWSQLVLIEGLTRSQGAQTCGNPRQSGDSKMRWGGHGLCGGTAFLP